MCESQGLERTKELARQYSRQALDSIKVGIVAHVTNTKANRGKKMWAKRLIPNTKKRETKTWKNSKYLTRF